MRQIYRIPVWEAAEIAGTVSSKEKCRFSIRFFRGDDESRDAYKKHYCSVAAAVAGSGQMPVYRNHQANGSR